MNKILIISSLTEESEVLQRQLTEKKYAVEVATTAHQAVNCISKNHMNLIVFNLDVFTKEKVRLASDLRFIGYQSPVLILSRIGTPDTYKSVKSMYRTVLLEKPYEEKDLLGVTNKLLLSRKVAQRIQRRFNTDQMVSLTKAGSNNTANARLFNISKSGAYFECEAKPEIINGDLVKMNFNFNQRVLNGRVIWVSRRNSQYEGHGIGVSFLPVSQIRPTL